MDDYLTLTDDQLKAKRNNVHRLRLAAEQEAERYELIEDEIWTEMKRRELEAFWQEHPGLRLEVGDELQITPEFIVLKRDLHNWDHISLRMLEVRSRASIADLEFRDTNNPVRIWLLDSSTTAIPLSLAREMRQAYLDREGNK